jgi:hypothetical protein
VGVSVTNSASETLEWSVASSPAIAGTPIVSAPFSAGQLEFRFEFTGAPTNSYLIKYVILALLDICALTDFFPLPRPLANPELVVASSGQAGILDLAVPNSADP